MQFLGLAPGSVAAIIAQVLNYQTNIFEMPHAGFRVPEPKAFRMRLHQISGPFNQFWRGRCWRRKFS